MLRPFAAFIALSLSMSPLLAQESKDSDTTSVPVAPAAPVDPIKKRSEEIDKLFGELHLGDAQLAERSIGKIWTLWESNNSPTAELLLQQSGKAMKDGVFETSETMLNELLGAYPDYIEALNKRAMLYYNMGRYDEATADIDAVLDAEPRHFGALSGRAAIYQAQGKTALAAQTLREAIAINPFLESAKQVLKQLEHDYPDI
jgi:tetratricopeptide (TPR) repeat protein